MTIVSYAEFFYIQTERSNKKFKNVPLTIYTLFNREHILYNDWCKIINNPKHTFYNIVFTI